MQTVPRVLDVTTGNTVEDKASSPVSARTPPVCVYDLTGTVMTNGGACAMRMPMTRSSPGWRRPQVVTFGDSATYWAPEPLPVCDLLWPGHDTDSKRVRTGQTQATAPHTRPP